MTAFIIATITIRDRDRYQDYAEKFWPTLKAFEGNMLIRGNFVAALKDVDPHDMAAILHFPDRHAMLDWYASPEYTALMALRDDVADMRVTAYEAFE